MCRATHFEAQNLGGCATLLLSWAYYRIGLCRPQGDYDELRFPLIEGWRGYVVGTDSLGPRVRMWRMCLNGVEHEGALVRPLLCFAIIEWHQVDRVVMQLGAMQHIPLRPLNIDVMHRHDGRWGKGEWYPRFLRGWYDLWRDHAQSRLALEMVGGAVQPSRQYLRWYYLKGHKDPVVPAAGMIPPFCQDWLPDAPEMVQPDDDALPAEQPNNAGRRRRAAGKGWGWGAGRGDGGPAQAADHMPVAAVDDDAADFDPQMTAADYMSIGLAVPSHPSPDSLASPSHHQSPMQIHMDGTYEQPRASTLDVNFAPDNYTQWVADMIAQSSY
ncbi:hypothetical protein PIB30_021685 [Stylosanthes scabra]|uniref:Aminotransferase-like plant mobile domain-containing protein n=1 Tax=Stylosanthes scabra TaxID=79078 RepID=A0ABU6QAF1_9FABA|nr:hypothetical protein [Stylosanthes scabra]